MNNNSLKMKEEKWRFCLAEVVFHRDLLLYSQQKSGKPMIESSELSQHLCATASTRGPVGTQNRIL